MTKEEIIQELEPMFIEARNKKLWFRSTYQDIWFSPDELENEQKNNKFVWGVAHWRLVDPNVLIGKKESEIYYLVLDLEKTRQRVLNFINK